jgi:hypothetical protein
MADNTSIYAGAETGATDPGVDPINFTYDNYDPHNLTGPADGDYTGNSNSPAVTDAIAANAYASDVSPMINSSSANKPGFTEDRLKNPLGSYSSYTYQLSLYMIAPDAYEAFIASGRTKINTPGSGTQKNLWAYVVAQSGGVNNKTSARAPGFELDYYIDDLVITSEINGKMTHASTNITGFQFKIYEPYGFSFISRLKIARDAIAADSKIKNFPDNNDPSKQFFILGIRFQGYDKDGNLITAASTPTQDSTNPAASGSFERFYDITVTQIHFKLDGKMVVYSLSALSTSTQVAFGNIKGRVKVDSPIIASTVAEALGGTSDVNGGLGLFDILNQNENEGLKDGSITIKNVYKLKFIGDGVSDIQNASMISPADTDKSKYPMAKIYNSTEVTESVSVFVAPDSTKKLITFKVGTSIIQAISRIIAQSSYLEDAMTVIKDSVEESQGVSPEDQEKKVPKKYIRWYNLGSEVVCLGWDTRLKQYAYEITYVIQPYETPMAISVYSIGTGKYYGPHKRYEYWFTGKNSEIISYEQSQDTTYFVALANTGPMAATNLNIPTQSNGQINGDNMGRLSTGMAAQNSYVTNLYDPGNRASAKIKILGDPDFLMIDTPNSVNTLYNKFYSSGGSGPAYTINPSGGQVFIEINFKEARDYNNDTGLMDINDNIAFFQYPASIKKIVKGVSYMVTRVVSSFRSGKFVQDIDALLNDFPGIPPDAAPTNSARETFRLNEIQGNSMGAATGADLDIAYADQGPGPSSNDSVSVVTESDNYAVGSQITAPTGSGYNTANDDATSGVSSQAASPTSVAPDAGRETDTFTS